jgi:hypothetical protein
VALRHRLSPGVPLSIGIGLGCDTVRRGTRVVKGELLEQVPDKKKTRR